MGAEPRDVADADLAQVAEDAEQRADVDDVGLAEAGERRVDVLAILEVAPVARIDRGGDTTGECDVGAHEGAERQVIKPEGVSRGGKDAPAGDDGEASEDECVVAADGGADRTTGDRSEEPEEEDSQRSGEHRCSNL